MQRLGVTLGQGYFLARPAPVDEWAHAETVDGSSPRTSKIVSIRHRTRTG